MKILSLIPCIQGCTDNPQLVASTGRTAKGGVVMALELAESALDGLPIPGVKGSIGAVVKIIKRLEDTKTNAEVLKTLEHHVTFFREDLLKPLENLPEEDYPDGLKDDIKNLAEELENLSLMCAARPPRAWVLRFLDADTNKGDLAQFERNIKFAIDRFNARRNVNIQVITAQIATQAQRLEENNITIEHQRSINALPRAGNAAYNSGRAGGPSPCFEGTRTQVLTEIVEWMGSVDINQPRVFWLNGLAGIGKSTIARTVAEIAANRKILGGSFFFSRNEGDLRKSRLLFPTLAYHLAHFNASFGTAIGEALMKNADVAEQGTPVQLKELIINPLRSCENAPPIVLLVVDALDECDSESEMKDILHLILMHITNVPFSLRIFLTSRPEHHIRSVFKPDAGHAGIILHNVEESVIKQDIEVFLRDKLGRVPSNLSLPCPKGWPRATDIGRLVERSGKLFVFAATVVRFIENDRVRNPQKQLDIVLGAREATNAKPYAHLDQLYLQVLNNAISDDTEDDDIKRLHVIIGCIVLLRDPLSIEALATFTKDYSAQDVMDALYHLHSIIITPNDVTEAPRIYHPSFPDFITDPKRCTESKFAIVTPSFETKLLIRCLELIVGSLHRDRLQIEDPFALNTDIPDLNELVNTHIPSELNYACRFWSTHLLGMTEPAVDSAVVSIMHQFTSTRLLNWFEAMSYLGATTQAVACMRNAHDWAVRHTNDAILIRMLNDGHRFALSHQVVMALSAMHVYQTALPHTPYESSLYKAYEHEASSAIQFLHGVDPVWSPRMSTIHCKGDAVESVTYAPNGSRFATGLENGKIQIWDTTSTAHLITLECRGSVLTMSFLPDSKHILGAGTGKVAYLWDAHTGAQIDIFRGHSATINDISISANQLATASDDSTVRLWVIKSLPPGELDPQPTFSGVLRHSVPGPVLSVCFCTHSSRAGLLSSTVDGSIWLWDPSTGSQVKLFASLSMKPRMLASSPIDEILAVGTDDHDVKILDMNTGNITNTLKGYSSPVTSLSFSKDGACLATGSARSDQSKGQVKLWNVQTSQLLTAFEIWLSQVALSPDGKQLATVSQDGTCRLWEVSQSTAVRSGEYFDGNHKGWVHSVAISENGALIASGGDWQDPVIRLWDAETGMPTKSCRGHSGPITHLAFSEDASLMASGSADGTVRVWSVDVAEQISSINHVYGQLKSVSFQTNHKSQIITRTKDRMYVWDINAPQTPLSHMVQDYPYSGNEGKIGGNSKGYEVGLIDSRWLYVRRVDSRYFVRACQISEDFRICGFAFHLDKVVLACVDGQVVIMDISRVKSFLG